MLQAPNIEIQDIAFDSIMNAQIKLKMARLDKIHNLASGNKIYKLRPIIEYAKTNNYKQILSFGGAYSNHIHALALVTQQQNIKSIAVIRGEAKYAENPTLRDAQNAGMILEFVSREEYKQRNNQAYLAQLQGRFPQALIIPEGGSSQLAIQGCVLMAKDINHNSKQGYTSDILAIASGTGATAAGLTCGLTKHQSLVAYSVLKDESLKSRINDFIRLEQSTNHDKYAVHNANFGGYAKFDKALLDFILSWLEQTDILLDPIYTSKMCRRVIQQIEMGDFENGQSIMLIHSGGLQGWRGMQQRVESLGGVRSWDRISEYL